MPNKIIGFKTLQACAKRLSIYREGAVCISRKDERELMKFLDKRFGVPNIWPKAQDYNRVRTK